jgi:hypothetical protein
MPVIIGGSGADHTLAYSSDGILYRGLGKSVFSVQCHSVKWNGSIWVAGGEGSANTLAWSYDGLKWTGLGTSVFSVACKGLEWNGALWVAVGAGTNTIATSSDGKTWTGRGSSVFDGCGNGVGWNGSGWVAVGAGSTNTIAYSSNGISWTGIGKTLFTDAGYDVKWAFNKWIAVGQGTNTMVRTSVVSGSSGWTATSSSIDVAGYGVETNGSIVVAVGDGSANTISYSSDGISWTGLGKSLFSSVCKGVAWANNKWILAGSGTNVVVYGHSLDQLYSGLNTGGLFDGLSVGVAREVGAVVSKRALYLGANEKLVVAGPAVYDGDLTGDVALSFNMNLPV